MKQGGHLVSGQASALVLLLSLSGFVVHRQASAQSLPSASPAAPFTITQPATSARAITVDNSVEQPSISTIVPRLTGPAPSPHESLHDANTGAKIEEFGTAYTYANPLYGTDHLHDNEVGGQQGGGGGAASAVVSFVVARFGAPPPKLPPIAGIDLATSQPDVALVRFGLQADESNFPDTASVDVLDRALHQMGRARVTQIDIETRHRLADAASRMSMLRQVALALVHQGAHPGTILADGRRILPPGIGEYGGPFPGHVFSLVLLAGG